MLEHRRTAQTGFTLAEAMIAILFISIALFGYISLHLRIIHSGSKLEARQAQREIVGNKMVQGEVQARFKDVPNATYPASGSSTSSSSAGRTGSGSTASSTPTNRPGYNNGTSSSGAPGGYDNSGFWADTVPPAGYYDFQGWTNTTRPSGYDNFSWANTTQPTGTDSGNVFAQHPQAVTSIGGIAYPEAVTQSTVNGLPAGLTQVKATVSWTDREGVQSYLVDAYERKALPAW